MFKIVIYAEKPEDDRNLRVECTRERVEQLAEEIASHPVVWNRGRLGKIGWLRVYDMSRHGRLVLHVT
jgi:hypothetical protein